MTRALFCSVFALTVACGSSSSDDSATTTGGSSNTGGSHAGTSNSTGGSNAGTSNSTGGTGTAGTSTGTAGTSTGTGGTTGTAGAGTGGTGTAGSGTAGTGGTGGAPTADASVTQWGGDIAHTGHWVNASLTKANASKLALDTFTAPAGGAEYAGKFGGEVAALPLYLAGSGNTAGEYIVATTTNDIYAFNASTGALNWKHNLGASKNKHYCGTPSDNFGVLGTPVIDAASRTIYVVGGMSANGNHHELHALNADTGMELSGGWPVSFAKIAPFTEADVPDHQNQRSALSLVGGVVYVAFGGYCGDANPYYGVVVGVNAKDPSKVGSWHTLDHQAGIWAPGGLPSDGTGVFGVTGNSSASGDHSKSDSEEIIRVTDLGTGNRDAKNLFYPTAEWAAPMNSNDLDFGSSSPVVVSVPGSTPATVLVAPSKPGRVFFVDATNLGASLGQFADMAVANTTSQSVYTSPTAYTSAMGVHAAFVTGSGSQCADPVGQNDGSVQSVVFTPGSPPMPKKAWCAKVNTDSGTVRRTPISTNSAGTADAIVWTMNGSKLNGFDGDTGAVVFDGGTGTCAGVRAFTTLIVANGHLIAAGDAAGQAHLCSWSVHN